MDGVFGPHFGLWKGNRRQQVVVCCRFSPSKRTATAAAIAVLLRSIAGGSASGADSPGFQLISDCDFGKQVGLCCGDLDHTGVVTCTDQEPASDQRTGVLERSEPGALFMVRLVS